MSKKIISKKYADRAEMLFANLSKNHYELLVIANKITSITGEPTLNQELNYRDLYAFIIRSYARQQTWK